MGRDKSSVTWKSDLEGEVSICIKTTNRQRVFFLKNRVVKILIGVHERGEGWECLEGKFLVSAVPEHMMFKSSEIETVLGRAPCTPRTPWTQW